MKALLILIICFPFLIFSALADPPDTLWTKVWGDEGEDAIYSIDLTSDSGFILTGWTTPSVTTDSDVWLVKMDEYGNEEWSQVYGGDLHDYGYHVIVADDGGYVVLARTLSYGEGASDIWFFKTDSNGNMEWSRLFGWNRSDYPRCFQKTSDGGYIILGSKQWGTHESDLWVIKTDSEGNEEWNRLFGGRDSESTGDIKQTEDNGYIVTGMTSSFGEGLWDVYLIKLDEDGNSEWERTYGGIYREFGCGVVQTADGGYVVGGVNESIDPANMNYWLFKVDSSGNLEWDNIYGINYFELCCCLEPTQDGGYMLGGGKFCPGYVDVFIVKTDSLGNEQWNQSYGEEYADWSPILRQTFDGGYLIAGRTNSTFDEDLTDAWLIKLGREVKVEEPMEILPIESAIQNVYPNPFNNQTNITISINQNGRVGLYVYDILGRQVATIVDSEYPSGIYTLPFVANSLPSGDYFIQYRANQTNSTKRITLIK